MKPVNPIKKLGITTLCLALAGALVLGGCGSKPEKEVVYETETLPENDGRPASLKLSMSLGAGNDMADYDHAMEEAVEEIIRKYQADFPNTAVELLPMNSDGEEPADIVLVKDSGAGGAGDLLDLSEYMDFWDNEGSLTAGAGYIIHYMGRESVYAVPVDIGQNLFFYRKDWFDQFNEDKTTAQEKVRLENWGRVLEVPEKLGDKGRMAVSRELAEDCFFSILWSNLGTGGLGDPAGAYYLPGNEGETIFSHEKAEKSVETFRQVYEAALDRGDMSGSEAVEAFVNGEAGVLIADARTAAELAKKMPEGTWAAAGFPQGDGNMAVTPCRWIGWGVRADTQEPEKAIHFLCYLTNGDNNTHLAKALGTLPIYKEALSMEPSLLEGDRAAEMTMLNDSACRYAGIPRTVSGFAEKDQVFQRELGEFLAGSLSTGELLETMDSRCREAFLNHQGLPIPWLTEE